MGILVHHLLVPVHHHHDLRKKKKVNDDLHQKKEVPHRGFGGRQAPPARQDTYNRHSNSRRRSHGRGLPRSPFRRGSQRFGGRSRSPRGRGNIGLLRRSLSNRHANDRRFGRSRSRRGGLHRGLSRHRRSDSRG